MVGKTWIERVAGSCDGKFCIYLGSVVTRVGQRSHELALIRSGWART